MLLIKKTPLDYAINNPTTEHNRKILQVHKPEKSYLETAKLIKKEALKLLNR